MAHDEMKNTEILKVVQGREEGKYIQVDCGGFWAITDEQFNFQHYRYRVKPEPREIWVAFNSNGSIDHVIYNIQNRLSVHKYHRFIEAPEDK